jgi:hypothetical protein
MRLPGTGALPTSSKARLRSPRRRSRRADWAWADPASDATTEISETATHVGGPRGGVTPTVWVSNAERALLETLLPSTLSADSKQMVHANDSISRAHSRVALSDAERGSLQPHHHPLLSPVLKRRGGVSSPFEQPWVRAAAGSFVKSWSSAGCCPCSAASSLRGRTGHFSIVVELCRMFKRRYASAFSCVPRCA